jgi:hypothetical protein
MRALLHRQPRTSRRTRRVLDRNALAVDQARTAAKIDEITRKAKAKQLEDDQNWRTETESASREHELHRRAQRLTGVAGFVAVVSLIVTAAAQTMFYTSLPWTNVYKAIAFVMFGFVEGPAWYFALNARDLADRGMPYSASGRRVWVFALTASAMNGYHGYDLFGRIDMGVILGLPSVVGPYVWHRHVHRLEMLASQRSIGQARAGAWRRIHHPFLSWRALKRWAEVGGTIDVELAFLQVFYEAHGYYPGHGGARGRKRMPASQAGGMAGACIGALLSVDVGPALIPISWLTWAAIGALSGAGLGTITVARLMEIRKASHDTTNLDERASERIEQLGSREPLATPVTAGRPSGSDSELAITGRQGPLPDSGPRNGASNVARVRAWVKEQEKLDHFDLSKITGGDVERALDLPNSSARNALRVVKQDHGLV